MIKASRKYPELGDREWLYQKYIVENLTHKEIANIINCTISQVNYSLDVFNIKKNLHEDKIFSTRSCATRKFDKLFDKDYLYQKYIIEGHSSNEIAEEINCGVGAVINALYRYKIRVKGDRYHNAKMHLNPGILKTETIDNKEWLYQKYSIEKLSTTQIAGIVGCCRHSVRKRLCKYHIHIRTLKEAHNLKDENGNWLYSTKEGRERMKEYHKKQKMPTSLTRPEIVFDNICMKNNLPIVYTGDSRFFIGDRNPDFVCCDGTHEVIEIFGDYWHSPLLNTHMRKNGDYQSTINYYKKYGYKCQIFWEKDILRDDAEQFILSNISIKPISMKTSP